MTAQQLGQVSDNIVQPSLRDEEMAVSSAQQANAPLEHLANVISDHALDVYKHEEVAQAQSQAMLDASQGKVGSINNLTNANQVYNHVMAKVAPSILASNGVSQLNGVYQNIVGSPNFNPATAMQDYQKQANQILGEYNKSAIDPQFKGEVNMLLQTHAGQVATKIATKVQDAHKQQFAMSAMTGFNNAVDNAQTAVASGDINGADSAIGVLHNIVNGGVASGIFTGKEGADMLHNATSGILINGAVANASKTGDYNVPAWAKDKLNPEKQVELQSRLNMQFDKDNATKKANALQQGYDNDAAISRAISGTSLDTDMMNATAEQRPYLMDAHTAGSYLAQAENFLSDGVKNRVFTQKGFTSLPQTLQNRVIAQYNRLVTKSKVDPASAYGLDKLGAYDESGTYQKRYEHVMANKLPIATNKLWTKDEVINWQNQSRQDLAGTINKIKQSAGPYTQQALYQVFGKDTATAALAMPNNDDYLAAIQTHGLNAGAMVNLYKDSVLDNNVKDAIHQNSILLKDETATAVNRTLQALSATGLQIHGHKWYGAKTIDDATMKDVWNSKYALVNGGLVLKDDADTLGSPKFKKDNITDKLKSYGISQSKIYQINDNLVPEYSVRHDGYALYYKDDQGKTQPVLDKFNNTIFVSRLKVGKY